MRKIVREHKGADVIPLARAAPTQRSLSCGVIGEGAGVFIELAEGTRTLRYQMKVDQAEEFATSLMQFVHECRNGGALT